MGSNCGPHEFLSRSMNHYLSLIILAEIRFRYSPEHKSFLSWGSSDECLTHDRPYTYIPWLKTLPPFPFILLFLLAHNLHMVDTFTTNIYAVAKATWNASLRHYSSNHRMDSQMRKKKANTPPPGRLGKGPHPRQHQAGLEGGAIPFHPRGLMGRRRVPVLVRAIMPWAWVCLGSWRHIWRNI